MKTMALLTILLAFSLTAQAAGGAPEGVKLGRDIDPNYTEGEKAIKAEDWPRAIEAFKKAMEKDADNADIHNWLGFAERKRGNLDLAFTHYERALKLDPKHVGVHEYVGEAYLLKGDLAKAEEHLKILARLCPPPCKEYLDLQGDIQAFKQAK